MAITFAKCVFNVCMYVCMYECMIVLMYVCMYYTNLKFYVQVC